MNTRRLRSKGTMASFGHGKKTGEAPTVVSPERSGENSTNDNVSSVSSSERNQPQHTVDPSAPPAKPCHLAWLALISCQNAVRMGAKTQLSLCPPGRARRNLQQALRNRARWTYQMNRPPSLRFDSEMSAYFGLDKMLGPDALASFSTQEEVYLSTTNTFDVDSDEEASSGDEDEISNILDVISPDTATSLDDEKKYANLCEPLFSPVGTHPAQQKGSPLGNAGSGKLPFNRRKLRFFDSVTAADHAKARAYLQKEFKKCRKRDGLMLASHLRRMQRRERREMQLEKGEIPDFDASDDENEDPKFKALLTGGVAQFDEPMTTSMAAALLLESLSMNPKESIEGMAKCYDGIVAAGVALLDSQVVATPDEGEPRNRRSMIMTALEPLLITSLEQPSGEVILQLAKLRRMCGTPRYQRRFVQRVAPCLVRPQNAAMWCLQHQSDMEPILAAVEMIFDWAFNIFKKGWYERGQLLLADSVRKETLKKAAQQLKDLSHDPEDGIGFSLNSTTHGIRRVSTKLVTGAAPKKDGSSRSAGNAPLAEWEVIAVDRQIRSSISNILSNDWSRVAIVSKDVELALKNRRGLAAPVLARSKSGGEPSPKSLASPGSPGRTTSVNPPLSPPHSKHPSRHEAPETESMESVFGPSFASQPPSAVSQMPVEGESNNVMRPSTIPVSPPMTGRKSFEDGDSTHYSHNSQFAAITVPPNMLATARTEPATPVPEKAHTPPRSPGSPVNDEAVSSIHSQLSTKTLPQAASPRRPASQDESDATQNVAASPPHPSFGPLERVERAPLSPKGTASAEAVAYRPASSASSVASSTTASSHPAHYRMLTSTVAERKRTVAACRALRAQISRFEEAFMQLHGRPPKGAAERAPLATTYAQYREWKRAIRADAACRIQALFRGARCRWTLLRSNNPRIARVVMTRAGRAFFGVPSGALGSRAGPEEAVIRQLSIPMEIGNESGAHGPERINSGGRTAAPSPPVFDDPFLSSPSSASPAPLAPHWSTPGRRPGNGETFPRPNSMLPPYSAPSGSASPTGAVSVYTNLSLPELIGRKKELKQQLKQYDIAFARQHGRMPVKAEKEPIRHLYENYNALKNQITRLEEEGAHLPAAMQSQNSRPPPTSVSPLGIIAGPDSSGDVSSPNMLMARPKRKPARQAPPLADPAPTSTPTGAPSQDLAALKAEKQKLHQMLRSYEKDFFKEHKRQVSSFADIKPVASQYRRYKEIKKAIAQQQQLGGER